MDPVITRALSDALGKLAKKSRDEISAGEHEIDETVTLRIKGTMNVLEDEIFTPTADIPLKVTLALFIHHSGVTGDAAMNALVKAMKEALEIQALPKKQQKAKLEAIREIADLEVAEEKVRKGLDDLPEKPRKGKVTTKAVVEEVAVLKGPVKAADLEEAAVAEAG